jgi:hypothetical protein
MGIHAYRWAAVSAVVAAFVLAATAPPAWAAGVDVKGKAVPWIPFKDARLKIEFNATDQDAGLQLFVDADPWKLMNVFDPRGKMILRATMLGNMAKQGGTELFLESGEPLITDVPLEKFFKRFPAGDYQIVAEGTKGERLVGVAKFTHNIPDGPVLVSPPENAIVDPNNVVVMWQPVGPANGSPIVGYQVLVVKPNTGLAALPKIILDVMMPPSATSMAVPPGFLLPDSAYEWEILAIESGGNQTLSLGHFQTAK